VELSNSLDLPAASAKARVFAGQLLLFCDPSETVGGGDLTLLMPSLDGEKISGGDLSTDGAALLTIPLG
jgi:hypothetical protein